MSWRTVRFEDIAWYGIDGENGAKSRISDGDCLVNASERFGLILHLIQTVYMGTERAGLSPRANTSRADLLRANEHYVIEGCDVRTGQKLICRTV